MLLDTANDGRRGDDCEEYEFKSTVRCYTANDGQRRDDCEEYEFKNMVRCSIWLVTGIEVLIARNMKSRAQCVARYCE